MKVPETLMEWHMSKKVLKFRFGGNEQVTNRGVYVSQILVSGSKEVRKPGCRSKMRVIKWLKVYCFLCIAPNWAYVGCKIRFIQIRRIEIL